MLKSGYVNQYNVPSFTVNVIELLSYSRGKDNSAYTTICFFPLYIYCVCDL